jgi:heparosan-N-sulfate-glucuronate 5-epimerase
MSKVLILPRSRYSEDKAHIVTEEFNHITISCGKFNASSELGSYYLDMKEAFAHYEKGIFGDFDEQGIPMVGWGKRAIYSTVNIAQYGFILHYMWLENRSNDYLNVLTACLNKLIELESHEGEAIFWRESYSSERYNLSANWASAMSSGECLSFYLRMYQITHDKELLAKAGLIVNGFDKLTSENGIIYYDKEGDLWLEEYPSEPASRVLNGFIYALLGLVDYYRITEDARVKEKIDACFVTLEKNISLFDAGYWSYYDLYYKELVKYYYQKNVHVPLLEVLYKLSGKKIFKQYAKKWKRSTHPVNILFVKVMYRVWPRWQKLKKFIL